jgi:hypothetical protein
MICLNNTDTLEGGASVDSVVDYTVHGLVGTAFTQIAQGKLSNTDPSVLYTAAAAISIVSVIFVNTHSAAVTVNLYLDPANAGTPRRLIPKALSLGVGYSMHFDGSKITVMDSNGNVLSVTSAHKLTHQDGGADEISVQGLSGLLAEDQHVLDSEVIAALAGLSSVKVHLSADQSIPNETFQKVALNTEDFDTLNEFDPVTNYRFTATKAGYYQVNASAFFYSTPAAGKYYDILIFKNGGSFARGRQVSPSTVGLTANASAVINLAVGDYIELYVYHNTGVAVLLYCDSALTQMSIHRLS